MTIPKDKLLHFAAGLVIGFLGALMHWGSGLLLAVGAGVGKEVWDKQTGKGTPEWQDAVFTTLGGFIGVVIHVLWRLYA